MNLLPVNVISKHLSGPGRLIGLFLARLMACLLRLREHGETIVPPHLAKMVSSADEMVHAYICNLAAMRLKSAGYTHAADALRTRRADRKPFTQTDPAALDDLTARLEDTIDLFNQAEALSAHFARLVFCALCMITADEPDGIFPVTNTFAKHRVAIGRAFAYQYIATAGRGPP